MGMKNLVTWTIPNFPKQLKDKFVGLCRAVRGISAKERLTKLIENDVKSMEKTIKK